MEGSIMDSGNMIASPVVPGTAKQLRVKRRVVNLVNPADVLDFSDDSISLNVSITSPEDIQKENTPSPKSAIPAHMQTLTPLGMDKNGVKGILRPSGTPGSGNGGEHIICYLVKLTEVRFFPKNKFRVITPNQSLNPPPAPAPPAPSSFLSSLLAVTASMSPRRTPSRPVITPPADPEESWEQPGQEGEVSLVASSIASERSQAEWSEQSLEEISWNGAPQIHSSPLGLTNTLPETSTDTIDQGELPSRDMFLPADMSDLLGQKLADPSGLNSFSISDFSRTNSRPVSQRFSLSPIAASPVTEVHDLSMGEDSFASDRSSSRRFNDSNPTIRLPLAPLPSRASPSPKTPPPVTKGFSSIFADMSAEQAELTWPLTQQASPLRSEVDEDDTAFHSALFANVQIGSDSSPNEVSDDRPSREERSTPGNVTQYFDCVSPATPAESLMTVSSGSLLPLTPSPFSSQGGLINPAKALFTAHSAHTSALASELQLYQKLVTQLQAEVSERDGLLVELNLKVIEGEVWRTRADELEKRVKNARTMENSSRRQSLSPSPSANVRLDHPGDRTTVDEAKTRDLEIRLSKAKTEHESLAEQLQEMRAASLEQSNALKVAQASAQKLEESQRDAMIQHQRSEDALRTEIELLVKREKALLSQVHSAKTEAEEDQRGIAELEDEAHSGGPLAQHNAQLEVDIRRLHEELESAKDVELGLRACIDRMDTETEQEHNLLADLEDKMRLQEQTIMKMKQEKSDDERELGRMAGDLDEALSRLDQHEDLRGDLQDVERSLTEEKKARESVEKQIKAERRERADLETEIRELRQTLAETQTDLLNRLEAPNTTDPEIARLRSESASKDLEIVTLQRRKNELEEDLEMLNIALDSKQQEIELMKRKFAVKGVAGSTPLASSRKINNASSVATPMLGDIDTPLPGRMGAANRRRSSAAFVTPSMGSIRGTGRVLKGGHGTDSWQTANAVKTVDRVEEENRPPQQVGSIRGSTRRDRVLA